MIPKPIPKKVNIFAVYMYIGMLLPCPWFSENLYSPSHKMKYFEIGMKEGWNRIWVYLIAVIGLAGFTFFPARLSLVQCH